MSQEIACPHCRQPLAPTASHCGNCGHVLGTNVGSTENQPSVTEPEPAVAVPDALPPLTERPPPDVLPPWTIWLHVVLGAAVVLFGLALNPSLFHGSRGPGLLRGWKTAAVQALWGKERRFWRLATPPSWPEQSVRVALVASGSAAPALAESLLSDSGMDTRQVVGWTLGDREKRADEMINEAKSGHRWLIVEVVDDWLHVRLTLLYYAPAANGLAFAYDEEAGLLGLYPWLVQLGLSVLLAAVARTAVVGLYRRHRRAAYQEEVNLHMIAVEEQLALRADIPSPMVSPDQATAVVFLRVIGSPFAYRAMPGSTRITIGRQRRKPGTPADQGNDIVIRVPGSNEKSLRISRRHLEIERLGQRYYVRDCSKGGTRMNGEELPDDRRLPLRSGDFLLVAGTLTLEFLVRADPTASTQPIASTTKVPMVHKGGLELEATVGDLVTVDPA